MKLLAIDSSGLVAAAALLDGDILVGESLIHNKKTHSQTLLPMIHDMLRMAEVDIKEVETIAAAAGPGSFTGLRIGAATAKGLAQALDIPIAAVPTLEALAYNMAGADALVCPAMDARRNQTYYGIYYVHGEVPVVVQEQTAAPVEDMVRQINQLGKPIIFCGDGVPVFRSQLIQSVMVPSQRASSVAALGKIFLEKGMAVPAGEFAPIYLRMSQAERERMERNAKGSQLSD